MTTEEHYKYWISSAEHDLDTAEALFSTGKYDWCLFISHLVLEKALKAIFVKRKGNKIPPKIHNLVRLSEIVNLELSEDQKLFFDKVNDFNIETRYPQYKDEFFKICTKQYVEKYFNEIKVTFIWLKSL